MRKRIFIAIVGFLAVVCVGNLFAAVPDKLIAPRLSGDLKIDGDAADWPVDLFADEQKLFLSKDNGFINVGEITNDKDFSATTYVMYDDKTLYVLAIARDDVIDENNPPASNWKNDCIELWFDGADDLGAFPGAPDNLQLNVDVNGEPWIYRDVNLNAKLVPLTEGGATRTGDGYVIEVAVPLSQVPDTSIKDGGQIGFSISFVDSDAAAWNHLLWLGNNEVNINEWGKLIFSGDPLSVEPRGKLAAVWGILKAGK